MKSRVHYENFWRANLEHVSALFALTCALFAYWYGRTYIKGFEFMALTCLPLVLLAFFRLKQAFKLDKLRAKLMVYQKAYMTEKELEVINKKHSESIFRLGV